MWTVLRDHAQFSPRGIQTPGSGPWIQSLSFFLWPQANQQPTPLSCPKPWSGCRDWEGQRVSPAPAASSVPARAAGRPRSLRSRFLPSRPPHLRDVSGLPRGQLPVNSIPFQVSLPPSLMLMHNTRFSNQNGSWIVEEEQLSQTCREVQTTFYF